MIKKEKHLSQFQLALRRFQRNRLAMICFYLLIFLYASAVFADFFAPYSYSNENRNYSYAPPTRLHMWGKEGHLTGPFVHGLSLSFDDYKRRIYLEEQQKKFSLKFFVRGDEYKFLGFLKCSWHLFGVEEPGRFHLLGADSRGRDIFSRILHGGRISLSIGLIGVLISFTIGLFVGGLAGYLGGWIDDFLMRLCEIIMMIPGFYLLLALRAVVPDDFSSLQVYFAIIVILSFIGWAGLARIIRGMCLSLRTRDYVVAAKTMGVSTVKIILKHILPHTLSYSIVAIMLSIPGYILGESALSLLGLGIQDPYASWGNMLSDAMNIVQIKFAPWILLPGFFIFLTVVCFNMVGDALRDCLDPLYKAEGKI